MEKKSHSDITAIELYQPRYFTLVTLAKDLFERAYRTYPFPYQTSSRLVPSDPLN